MINKVTLIGNLGADPETSNTGGGNSLTKMRLATSEKWTDQQGNKQEKTEWHRVVAWGKLAEVCGQYLRKGSKVYIEGKISYGSYEKDGNTFHTTDIVARDVQFLDSKGDKQEKEQNQWGDGKRRGGPRHVANAPRSGYNAPPPSSDVPF